MAVTYNVCPWVVSTCIDIKLVDIGYDTIQLQQGSSECSYLTFGVKGSSECPCLTFGVKGSSECPCLTFGVKGSSECPCLTFGVKGSSECACLTFGEKGHQNVPGLYLVCESMSLAYLTSLSHICM